MLANKKFWSTATIEFICSLFQINNIDGGSGDNFVTNETRFERPHSSAVQPDILYDWIQYYTIDVALFIVGM